MKGMPFDLQGKKGVFEVVSDFSSCWKEVEEKKSCSSREPTSVLDTRRSPSPPTSCSTLSSSLGGGGGSTDTGGVAAVSNNNPPHNWPSSTQEGSSSATAASGGGGSGSRKDDDWGSDLQPIPTSLDTAGTGTGGGVERCGGGLVMEDWESMLSDTVTAAASSPSQDQSLLRWIMMGDVEDPSSGLKQLLQSGVGAGLGLGPSDLDSNNGGFGLPDPGFGFEPPNSMNAATSSGFGFSNNGRATVVSSSMQNPSFNNTGKVSSFNNPSNPIFSGSPNTLPLPLSLPPGMFYQHHHQQQQQHQYEQADQKPQLLINHPTQNQSFFVPLPFTQETQQQHNNNLLIPPQAKRHHSAMLEGYSAMQQQQQQGFPHQMQLLPNHLQQRSMLSAKQQKVVGTSMGEDAAAAHHQQQQALIDQLFKAAELVESGNLVHARAILARLNHQLSSPVGKPLLRACYYFKEALQLLLQNLTNNNLTTSPPKRISNAVEVVHKIDTYKSFSEISPILQFVNFTCNQALLESLENYHCIHIIDFDIGFGVQWASFMQEIALRVGGAPSLKITAIASPSSYDHPLELVFTQDNLAHFANDLGIPFKFELVSLDSFETLAIHENEAIAVNLPVGSSSYHPSSLPSLLRLVKQISPKVVVSIDRGCDQSDLSFARHFVHGIQSYAILFDSLDSINTNFEVVNKIEKFLFLPRIETAVLRRHNFLDKLPPWRTLFATAGFSPYTFSNFCETQAECLVKMKRLQMRGFHVDKRQASLVLYWQRQELVSASAWSC